MRRSMTTVVLAHPLAAQALQHASNLCQRVTWNNTWGPKPVKKQAWQHRCKCTSFSGVDLVFITLLAHWSMLVQRWNACGWEQWQQMCISWLEWPSIALFPEIWLKPSRCSACFAKFAFLCRFLNFVQILLQLCKSLWLLAKLPSASHCQQTICIVCCQQTFVYEIIFLQRNIFFWQQPPLAGLAGFVADLQATTRICTNYLNLQDFANFDYWAVDLQEFTQS